MTMTTTSPLPSSALALKLFKIVSGKLIACEAILFNDGVAGIDTVLRRAAISGRVDIGGKVENHFADVLDTHGSMVETVALDAGSYRALKNRWMRCQLER
jgi:hypothetical protein